MIPHKNSRNTDETEEYTIEASIFGNEFAETHDHLIEIT
jgi:hypothetical protein